MVQVRDICSARKMLGLSQEKLAEALGVSRNTISRWERGECSPNAAKMAELERMLAQLEAPTAPEDAFALEETPAPKAATAPLSVFPTQSKRWLVLLVCAGVVCVLLIGIMTLVGVYSINQRLEPDNVVPAEEIEGGEEVDGYRIVGPITLRPLEP